MKLFNLLLSFLCMISSASCGLADTDKFERYRSLSRSAPIELNDSSYEEITSKPRDYHVAVLLTAADARYGCILCREFQPEWELIARSWNKGPKPDGLQMLFGTLDFSDGKGTFQKLMLQTAPVLLVFPPTVGPFAKIDDAPLRFDFSGPISAEQLYTWMNRQLPEGPKPPLVRPINYMRLVSGITILMGAVTLFTVLSPYVLPIVRNRNLWAAFSLIAILLFTSGHMFNHIRKVPYVAGDGRGGISYFAGGFSNQFGMETQIVAAIYAVLSFATIALAMKVPRIADNKAQQVAVIIWGSVLLEDFLCKLASREVSELPYYHASVIITSVASLMELSTEPFFTVVQQYMLHRQRAVVEMSAAFVKSLTTCLACAWASRTGHSIGVLPFSIGYLCYSSTLICGYILALPRVADEQKFSMFPTKIKSRSDYFMGRFSWPMIGLSTNVFFQSVVKHLLTQGDSMMLATMTSLEDQGIYALASNYGGLLARVLFQPIEESSRTLFSSLLNSGGSGNLRVENINAAKTQLTEVLRAYSLMAVVGFPLGPVLAPQLLHLLGGRIWASPRISSLLSLYCYYIPFLAYNGISEAFVSSAANSAELRRQAVWMGVFSACFASAAYLFLKVGALGAHGMVYANIVNMAVRIVWSFSFIQTFMSRHGSGIAISELSPRPLTCIASITMSIVLNSRVLYALDIYRTRDALILGAMYILLVSYLERKYLLIYYTKAHELVKFKTSSTPKSKSE
ncbi:hypothetical protein CBS63078_8084 [Aspergillus niger]|nr:hypothetical protein CBS133816_10819 [Aspergillus niger]KAI2815785.1 hypothetical protein CBS115989_7348 [Aspergillus niger]KAI2844188.1 hypothetical protein CBS11350_4961 [Aspergillus niger]KAI2848175.1 hypothetical protein CBS11232_6892 [Aspergillus niger]KAI2863450.1 hypothetical protein CBS12448_3748 [Aspergillus niger]